MSKAVKIDNFYILTLYWVNIPPQWRVNPVVEIFFFASIMDELWLNYGDSNTLKYWFIFDIYCHTCPVFRVVRTINLPILVQYGHVSSFHLLKCFFWNQLFLDHISFPLQPLNQAIHLKLGQPKLTQLY